MGIDQADDPDDQDRVFLLGEAAFVDLSQEVGGPGGVMNDNGEPYVFQFCIELREGPPGIGGFFYTDEVVLLGAGIEYGDGLVDDGYDEEEIRAGHIQINFKGDVDDIPFDRIEDCPVDPLPL